MLIDGRAVKILREKDINSIVSLEEWFKSNLSIFDKDSRVPKQNLIDLLTYIKEQVLEQRLKDKRKWIEKIDMLIERESRE